jgi:hypothetical protein
MRSRSEGSGAGGAAACDADPNARLPVAFKAGLSHT